MIPRRVVISLGLSQLISWGVSYYLIGGFGQDFVRDFGWSRDFVYSGFALALLVMGLSSPMTGRWIVRHGGRPVMLAGSFLNAVGCMGLGACSGPIGYLLSWACLGLGMRFTLYDAAFAALARIAGAHARSSMSQITLLGGLASTASWPVGYFLSGALGWRNALYCFAGFALLTVPLHVAIPQNRYEADDEDKGPSINLRKAVRGKAFMVAGTLYALLAAMVNFLNAGMSTHMIGILDGLGVAAGAAVGFAAFRGVGQSSARLGEVVFGRHICPLTLNLLACLLMPLCFVVGLYSGVSWLAAVGFAFAYGACNGILTITRGTVPLMLFGHEAYGELVGRLVAPSFMFSAIAPIIYAFVIDRFGTASALTLSIGCAVLATVAGAGLYLFSRPLSAYRACSPNSDNRIH